METIVNNTDNLNSLTNLKIITVGDIHATPVANDHGIAQLNKVVAHINGLSPAPDLVVFLGDLVDNGSSAGFLAVKKVTDTINVGIRKVFVKGNHDAVNNKGFCSAFGANSSDQIISISGYQLIFIDISVTNTGCTKSAPCWVSKVISNANTNLPTIVFIHGLPYKLPSPANGGCSMGSLFGYVMLNPSNIQLKLGKFSNLIAVFAGHMHMDYEHTLNMTTDAKVISTTGLKAGTKFIINGVLVPRPVGCPNAGYATKYIGSSLVSGNTLTYSKVAF